MADIVGTNGADNRAGTSSADAITLLGGNDTGRGSSGNDSISGASGDDDLDGGRDNDSLNGGVGNDSLRGSYGYDLLIGGAGDDSISGGLSASDTLQGGAGNDSLDASSANSVLVGGQGTDRLNGSGSAPDRYVFDDGDSAPGAAVRDVILRLEGGDVIDLRPVDGNTAIAGDQRLAYIGTFLDGAAFTAPGQVRVVALNYADEVITNPNTAVGAYLVQANTGGTTAPDLEIYIGNTDTDPSAAWFLL